jgi:hypothetical protein
MNEVELLSRALEIAAFDRIAWCCVCEPAAAGSDEHHSPATYEVEWSDRCMWVCENHLAKARESAANDNSGDRTDSPYVRPIRQPTVQDIVQAWCERASKL